MAEVPPPTRHPAADTSSRSIGLTILAIVAGLILLWIIYMVAFADSGVTGSDGLDVYDNGVQTPTNPDSIYTPETAPTPGTPGLPATPRTPDTMESPDTAVPPTQTGDTSNTTTTSPGQPSAN